MVVKEMIRNMSNADAAGSIDIEATPN